MTNAGGLVVGNSALVIGASPVSKDSIQATSACGLMARDDAPRPMQEFR